MGIWTNKEKEQKRTLDNRLKQRGKQLGNMARKTPEISCIREGVLQSLDFAAMNKLFLFDKYTNIF